MNDTEFWTMIELAWQTVGGREQEREALAAGTLHLGNAEELQDDLEVVIPALEQQLGQLSAEELLAFDRLLERKLYDIDREDIHEYTDGSDDGFLYARGFIVATGKAYYEAVLAQPSIALADLEGEEMCYLSSHLYEGKFGDMPPSEISRESCSNTAGWPNLTG